MTHLLWIDFLRDDDDDDDDDDDITVYMALQVWLQSPSLLNLHHLESSFLRISNAASVLLGVMTAAAVIFCLSVALWHSFV